MYHKRGARVAVKQLSPQELTDLVTEAVNAVAELQKSEFRDRFQSHLQPMTEVAEANHK
jgi:hypothetical protein